jgi:Neurotransmitter-gated ion-channel ligand binding domain
MKKTTGQKSRDTFPLTKLMVICPTLNKAFPSQSEKPDTNITAEIHNVLSINEIDDTIKVTVKLILEWYDSRLMFRNINSSQHFNILNENESTKIWQPEVVFINIVQKNFEYNVKPHVTIIMNDLQIGKLSDYTEVHSSQLYSGNKNIIQSFFKFR